MACRILEATPPGLTNMAETELRSQTSGVPNRGNVMRTTGKCKVPHLDSKPNCEQARWWRGAGLTVVHRRETKDLEDHR